MPATDRFLDTNILLYLLSEDRAKADRAEALLAQGGVISVQVLNEFAAVARRKLRMEWDEIDEILATFRQLLTVVPLTVETHLAGLKIARETGYAIYDSMILAAAGGAGAARLISEDMQHGQAVGGVTIENPFRAA